MGLIVLKDQDYQRYQEAFVSSFEGPKHKQRTYDRDFRRGRRFRKAVYSMICMAALTAALFIVFSVSYARIVLAN